MSEVPPDFMAAGFTAQRDGCTSQLSNMASNFSHWRALVRLQWAPFHAASAGLAGVLRRFLNL
jgi:hypothetical protein